MRLLFSQAFSGSSLTFFLPNGNWGAFMLVFRGTNGAVAKTRDDVGNVNLTWQGVPLINVDYEFLSFLTDLKGGVSTFSSVALGAFNTSIYLPCGEFKDKNNIYRITEKEKVYFKLDFPLLSDIVGQVYIYGIPKEGIMNYQYCLTSRNVSAGASGTISDVHRLQNVSQIYLKDHTLVTSAQILKDNQTLIDGLIPDLQILSDYSNQVETSNALIEMDINRSRDIREVLGSEINFKYAFTGAATLGQYFAYTQLTPQNARASMVDFANNVKIKIDKGMGVVDGIKPIVQNVKSADTQY